MLKNSLRLQYQIINYLIQFRIILKSTFLLILMAKDYLVIVTHPQTFYIFPLSIRLVNYCIIIYLLKKNI